MRGSGIEILVGPKQLFGVENQDNRTWCLSKTWLAHHSGLFKRFVDGKATATQIIIDNDPDIFTLFVEFMIRGQYTYRDDLTVHEGVRESAKAWVLGEYLDAPKFQNLAMRNLFNIYKGYTRSGVGPESILYICENCESSSPLYRFYRDVTCTYWGNKDIVVEEDSGGVYIVDWAIVFERYPDFRDDLLLGTRDGGSHIKPFGQYRVPEEEDRVARWVMEI